MLLFSILFILIILTIAFVKAYTKRKTSSQIMLMGVEITIVGVAAMSLVGGEDPNDCVTFKFIGLGIIIVGFTISILGFVKN